jgi:hypothetical protein
MIARRPVHDKHASVPGVPEVTFFAIVCNLCIRVHSDIPLLCHRPLCRVDRAGRELRGMQVKRVQSLRGL